MKVLVTGYKGFIGSHVYNNLKYELGYGELVDIIIGLWCTILRCSEWTGEREGHVGLKSYSNIFPKFIFINW